jgi:signal transduction histidine kinase/ligand-binding sensor domain-containing protein
VGEAEGLKGQWSSWAYDGEGQLWFANSTMLGRMVQGQPAWLNEDLGDRLCIASSRLGGLWIASNERLCRLEKGEVQRLVESPPWAGAARVRTLFEDSAGNLWIGTSARGLYRFAQGKLESIPTSHSSINWIREDTERNLWVATHGGGLNRLRRRIFDFYNSGQGLIDDISYSICENSEGRLWIGNCDGGLASLQRGTLTRALPELAGESAALRVFSVGVDAQDNVWIGTRTGLYFWEPDSGATPKPMAENAIRDVHVIFRSRAGDMWVGADPDVLGRFRDGQFELLKEWQNLEPGRVRAIAETPSGELWIGTESGGLFRFRHQNVGAGHRLGAAASQRFTREEGWPNSAVRALHADEQGGVWIGTSGGGLIVFENGRFARISSAQGLPANAIFQIVPDDRGRLWFGSPAGLFHVARETLLACARGQQERVPSVMFGRSDGLAGVSCLGGYQPTATRTANGELWFATRQGLLKVDTAAELRSELPPPIRLNACLADNRPIDVVSPLRIPADVRKLEIRFAVLSYTAPERVQVRYRLEGFDVDWVEAGSARSVSYPKLPPAEYQLRISACNSDGVWNEDGLKLAFMVLPAWWQTAWFRALMLGLFTCLIGISVRYWSHRRLRTKLERLEQQQALEKERSRIARDLHDDLGVSLTQIALLAEMSADASLPPERLKSNLTRVVTGARNLVRELDGILWTVNPKNDSLDKLASFLCQFSQQFFRLTTICCRFDVSDAILPYPLSPDVRHDLFLVVKEAMNNVVKHSNAGEVWLRLRMEDKAFVIRIEDNGRGLLPETLQTSERNGMRNMRTRIEGVGGTFELQSEPGRGTALVIRFPLSDAGNSNARRGAEARSPKGNARVSQHQ